MGVCDLLLGFAKFVSFLWFVLFVWLVESIFFFLFCLPVLFDSLVGVCFVCFLSAFGCLLVGCCYICMLLRTTFGVIEGVS